MPYGGKTAEPLTSKRGRDPPWQQPANLRPAVNNRRMTIKKHIYKFTEASKAKQAQRKRSMASLFVKMVVIASLLLTAFGVFAQGTCGGNVPANAVCYTSDQATCDSCVAETTEFLYKACTHLGGSTFTADCFVAVDPY